MPTLLGKISRMHVCSIGILGLTCLFSTASAQEPTPEFTELFNGKDLSDWEGDARFWRVESGAIVGETTPENPAAKNTFLIYRGGTYADFEMRFQFKVEGFNSGMQYRSVAEDGLVMKGMQADFEARWHTPKDAPPGTPGTDDFSGMYFEEGGRAFMGKRGEVVLVRPGPNGRRKPAVEVVATVGETTELEAVIKRDDWNDYTIIASGRVALHIINGRVMSAGVDEDPSKFRPEGLIGLQLHSGRPMRIDVRAVRIRALD